MKAQIITIGDELLIGQVIDTNSAWLGEKLTASGINVDRIISISDKEEDIIGQLERSVNEAEIVIISGGLGPTKDDITKSSLAKFLGVEMQFNQDVYKGIVDYLLKHGRKEVPAIKDHSFFPEGCVFLENKMGTAPGMVFKKNSSTIISVPGVPYEMKYIMENEGIPLLQALNDGGIILQKTILTAGEFEARLSDRISDIINDFPENLSIAFLPNLNQVRLRITAKGNNENDLRSQLEEACSKIEKRMGLQVFGYGKDNLAQALGKLLLKLNLTMSTAESCTGGYLSHLITSNAGSSDFYKGSIIAYSNEIKMKLLDVKKSTLEKYGAVSEQTVIEMVKGVLDATSSDLSISVSGIAGPGGGSEDKPVGTIWLACGNKNKIITKQIKLAKDRVKNIESSAIHGLDLLRLFVLEEYD